MMDGFFEFLIAEIGSRPILVGIIGISILVWLYFDMKRQKRWKAEKEASIAARKTRLAKRDKTSK